MEQSLIKGRLRKIINRAFKMSSFEVPYYDSTILPVDVTNVRMYVIDNRYANYKYRFEVDVEITVPTYYGGIFRYSDTRYITSNLRKRLTYKTESIRNKCLMFSGRDGNTEVVFKKISIIRNDTPPSLNNSQSIYVV